MQSCVSALQTPTHVTDTVLLSFLINWFDTKMRDWCSELYGFGSTDYNITFDLKDNNGINTTKNITVNLWANASNVDEPTADEQKRCAYIFKWNSTDKKWYGPTYGAVYVNSAASTDVSDASYGEINSTNVNVTFKLDKIAVPTNAISGWKINVTVYDEDGNCSTEGAGNAPINTSAFAVSPYTALTESGEAGVDFGAANPGAEVGDLLTKTTTVTHIANTQTDVKVQGADFKRSTGWGTIPISQFYFNTTDTTTDNATASGGAGVVQLTTSAQNGYTAFRNVTDALGIVDIQGYTDNKELGLAFKGSLPWTCRAGSYTATWTITAEAATPA